MKKIYITIALAFAILSTENTFAQQGFGTNQPDRSAAVDIVSSQRGLLIPRISINDLDQAAPVNQPANALFVYNTNSATGEGFYYWERDDKTLPTPATYAGRWVRFTSSINEKKVIVTAGDNVQVDPTISTDGLTKTYTVGVQGGSKDGQVLVTKIDNTDPANPVTTTEWTDPNTFVLDVLTAGNAIGIAADPNDPTKVEVKFNGTLSEDTTIETGTHNLSIKGLDDVAAMAADDKLVIMDENGLLKTISKTDLVDAKNLTSTGGIITLNGAAAANGSVLQDVELGIADRSIDPGKFKAEDTDEGKVPVVQTDGTVAWTTIPGTNSADLTTDGKIVIGNNTSTTQTLGDAVLVATQLSIAAESITSGDIKDGTIQVNDIKAPGTTTDSSTGGTVNQVMVTNANGDVSWIDQSALGNKDSYTGIGAIDITENGTSTNGINYDVSVATATGTTLGVVKEAAAPTVNINTAGELVVNLDNTVLDGDVTGPLNATKVEKIQGTSVSDTDPTDTNNVLVYNDSTKEWTPTELTGSHITGEALTSNSITVTPTSGTTNTALLEALNIEITPGTEGQILTTVNTAAAGDPAVLETDWTTVNSLVEADNGLNKNDTTDKIHLGGDLIEPTEIKTDDTNTLAISGLQPATETATNKVIVSEGTNGILRTVERVITGTNADVATNANYSFFTPEVVLNITLPQTGSDVTVNFPNATSAAGQVINIKIANTDETHSTYLNVLDTYGSMPYQGWIVKSNGSEWIIVGRN